MHVEHPGDERIRYLRAVIDAVKSCDPAFVVFAGDLVSAAAQTISGIRSHPGGDMISLSVASPGDISWALAPFESIRPPVHYLRGNVDVPFLREPLRFAFALEGIAFVGFDTAEGTLTESEDRWLREAASEFGDVPKIFFSHYYAGALDSLGAERLLSRLAESGARHLISGHGHRAEHHVIGQTEHHLTEAADPFKPGSHRPGFELFELDGSKLRRLHHAVSLLEPGAVKRFHEQLGCAPRHPGNPETLKNLLADCGLRHVQLRLGDHVVESLGGDRAVDTLRQLRSEGVVQTLSVHGSNPQIDPGGTWLNRSTIEREVEISAKAGAESVTSHLPIRDERTLFNPESGSPESAADKLADTFADGMSGYWQAGIRIDLENTHWLDPVHHPDSLEEHMLGIKINHLLWFRNALEKRLGSEYGDIEGAGVGCTFDVGHALTNGPLAATLTIPDWFASLGSHIRSIHFHDAVDLPEGGRQAHRPIGAEGGLVGLEGFIHLLHCYCPDAVLYLELDALEEIRQSVDSLRRANL